MKYFASLSTMHFIKSVIWLLLIILLIFLESIIPLNHIFPIVYPFSLLLITIVFILFPIIWLCLKKFKAIYWFSTSSSALFFISLFCFPVFIIAILPQAYSMSNLDKFGFSRVTHTWFFIIPSIALIFTLISASLRRLSRFNFKNALFFLNHIGLSIILSFGILGHGDKLNINIVVNEGELVWYGFDAKGNLVDLPFAIQLDSFNIENYSPQLVISNGNEIEFVNDIHKIINEEIIVDNTSIKVIRYIEHSLPLDTGFSPVIGLPYSVSSAQIMLSGPFNKVVDWICHESILFPAKKMTANNKLNIQLLKPEPKSFTSNIRFYSQDGINGELYRISVNEPLHYGHWTIYQSSYAEVENGSKMQSVFLGVYDRWLTYVYLGFALCLMGAVGLIFIKI